MNKGKRALLVALAVSALTGAASAQSIVDRWSSVTMPPPPTLEPVTVEPGHAALLILDMYPTSCNATQRPSCVPTIPRIAKLLADARAHKVRVIYSAGLASMNGPTKAVDALAAEPGDVTVRGPADKWIGSDLESVLKTNGITTVIVTGTSADGAVLYTASGAAMRGLKTIVPVDGMASANPFAELYTAWHLKNTTASVTRNLVLSRTDLIQFR